MCVAILVEGDFPLETALACEDMNPHGAGLAWGSEDRVMYVKGLDARDIARLAKDLPRPFLAHFRWATHGGRALHLSHPFPIGSRALVSRALKGSAESVLIHNGVWTDYQKWVPRWLSKPERWSDTAFAAFAAGIVGEEVLDHVGWSTATAVARGGGRLDITLRGRWVEHDDGNTYSNLNWVPRPAPRRVSHTPLVAAPDDWSGYWSGKEMAWSDEAAEVQAQLSLDLADLDLPGGVS